MVVITSCMQNQHIDIDKLPKPNFYFENGCMSDFKLNFVKDSLVFFLKNFRDTSDTYKNICNDFKNQIPSIDKIVLQSATSRTMNNSHKTLVCGLVTDIEYFNSYNFPVQKISNGFRFGYIDYTDISDGIYLEYDNAIMLVGNSYESLKKLLYDRWLNPYQYFITHDNEIIGFGNLKNNQYNDSLFCNIKKIRNRNYRNSVKSDLIDFHISYRFTLDDTAINKMNIIDSLLLCFINTVRLKKIEKQIPCYIHYNQDEIQIAGWLSPLLIGQFTFRLQ